MTVQAGWIGGKERLVSSILPVFSNAEERDLREGTKVIRNAKGQSYMALAYTQGSRISHSYDLIDTNDSLLDWSTRRLSEQPVSPLVMATQTRAANLTSHSKIPAVTVREVDNHTLVVGTTGSATQFRDKLGIPNVKGDTEDVSDWIISKGLENLYRTLETCIDVPCGMHMVFALIEHSTENVIGYLLRSKHHPEWGDNPYLHYSLHANELVYASRANEAESLLDPSSYIPIQEESIIPFTLSLAKVS